MFFIQVFWSWCGRCRALTLCELCLGFCSGELPGSSVPVHHPHLLRSGGLPHPVPRKRCSRLLALPPQRLPVAHVCAGHVCGRHRQSGTHFGRVPDRVPSHCAGGETDIPPTTFAIFSTFANFVTPAAPNYFATFATFALLLKE